MLELTTTAVIAVLVSASVIGIGTYWLRCHFRVLYGVFEAIVGLAVILVAVFPIGHDFLLGDKIPSAYEVLLNHAVTLLAGVYIIVRGFDNVDVGALAFDTSWLSEPTTGVHSFGGGSLPERFRKKWDQLFHAGSRPAAPNDTAARPAPT